MPHFFAGLLLALTASLAHARECPTRATRDAAAFQARLTSMQRQFDAQPAAPADAEWVQGKLDQMAKLAQSFVQSQRTMFEHHYTVSEAICFLDLIAPLEASVINRNNQDLAELVRRYGWFPKSKFGARASHDAALLARDLTDDRLQFEIMDSLHRARLVNEALPEDYAALADQREVARNGHQRYGTQGMCTGHGHWETTAKVDDLSNLDQIRDDLGLEPFGNQAGSFGRRCFVAGGAPIDAFHFDAEPSPTR